MCEAINSYSPIFRISPENPSFLSSKTESITNVADAARYGGDAARLIPCTNSFSAETLVQTEDGAFPISEILIGDMVLAYNEKTGEVGYYPVTDLIRHIDPVIVLLTVDGEVIETTPEHPFYEIVEWMAWEQVGVIQPGLWTDAKDLHIGDKVTRANGLLGTIESIQFVEQTQRMYNFTVGTAHTYFVGDSGWLVHNSKPCGFARGTAISALTPDRLQHASRHLTDAGLLPNWSRATGEQFIQLATNILENPTHTFDHVLRGGSAVKGYSGVVDGQNVAIFIYKDGPNAGKIATSIVPSARQIENWSIP